MRAVIWTKYGGPDVLKVGEVDKPSPKDNQVLIKIHATTATLGDCELRSLDLPAMVRLPMRIWLGLRKPKENTIPGTELAGEIEAVGKDVTKLKVGDQVFGSAGMHFGTYAEYICLPAQGSVAVMPNNMSYEEAAAVPFGGRDSLHFLRKGIIEAGQKVLINGAGGSIGTFGVMLAKHFGAEVTAVDSAEKLDMLRSIGADHAIDYRTEDFTKNGKVYDVIFDVVGTLKLSRSKSSLKKDGVFLLANPVGQMLSGLWLSKTSSQKVVMAASNGTTQDLGLLKGLVEAGKIKTVIDRSYPLEQIAQAHEYVETGHKQGNVVVTF